MNRKRFVVSFGIILITLALVGGEAFAQKYGGILRATIRSNPPNLSAHEVASTDTLAVVSPIYNGLITFDVFKPIESMDTIVPELAESWALSADSKNLTFKLRRGIKWHDGKPFTAADVKHTFDTVRGFKRSSRMKLNPRKLWFVNVKEITTQGDYEITFHLKRPQSSLLHMLAAGFSTVYPTHVSFAELRTKSVGTGPFKLKSYQRDRDITIEKNPAYWVKGRPYLDEVKFHIIKKGSTRIAALIGNQVDAGTINTVQYPQYLQLKKANTAMLFDERVSNATYNVIVNFKKPPFNNPRVRQAVNLAMHRPSLIRSFFQGGAVPGGAHIPKPYGSWGLSAADLLTLPGYGDNRQEEIAQGRKIMEAEGYSKSNPLKVVISSRSVAMYTGPATWMIDQLKQVWIDASLKTVEIANWYGVVARRDFMMGLNATAIGIDDPDAVLYETYSCGSQRNYSDYCNPELMKKVDAQSMETDPAKRKAMVREIDLELQRDLARPYLAYRKFYYPHYPYVKNWLPHTSIYNGWRLQDVWLDK